MSKSRKQKPTRTQLLAAFFEGRKGPDFDAVRERTRVCYDDEDFTTPARFALVERLELPGYNDVIVRTFDHVRDVESELARLYEDCDQNSWVPNAVLDLDTGEEIAWALKATLHVKVAK